MKRTRHVESVRNVVRGWIRCGEPDRAVLLLATAPRVEDLADAAGWLAAAGYAAQAVAMIHRAAARDHPRPVELVRAAVLAGDHALAAGIAARGEIDVPVEFELARGEERVAVAARSPDPAWQEAALADLARESADAGDHTGALRIARASSLPAGRARLLTGLADSATDPVVAVRFARAGRPGQRQRTGAGRGHRPRHRLPVLPRARPRRPAARSRRRPGARQADPRAGSRGAAGGRPRLA
ncbi:hypothetical protein V5P93_003652 [Actinokineospora auranticolor]|uniref:hypothetical protein n=1 Tax=Actinokineospora auranticolor TaxID=155976 RepID=UPI0011B0DF95|nr:hypothetical protein [Actinokineospora auranticolor]